MKPTRNAWSFVALVAPALLASMLSLPAHAADTLRYVVLVDNGKKAGHQVVERGDDGVTRVDFTFKDNGRGPELKEEYTLAPDGTYQRYAVKGTSTFGAPVDESFVREGETVRWKSTSDEGSAKRVDGGFYVSLGGTPDTLSVAAAAIARRGDGKLPLYPGGAMTLRRVGEATVRRAGEERKVALVARTGVGLVPQFAWLTTDASPRMFALIFPGFAQIIEEGWEANGKALEDQQKAAESEVLTAMQKQLSVPLAGDTLLRNARVFDSAKAMLQAASDVRVRDGRIVSVMPAGKDRAQAAQVFDAGGRVLLPGLFDMHGHVGRWDGGLHLAAGVTTVRDMGNDNATLEQIEDEENAGTLMFPRVVKAGFLEGESQMSARNGFVVATLDKAKEAIDWYAANGYVQVKIYNSFPKALLKDTVAYAHAKGLRVSGHVPAFLRAQDVVDAGFDEIQHINQVLLNFLVDDTTDTRTLARFYLPAKGVADLDFDSKPVQDFIAELAERQIEIDPTVTTFDFIRQRAGQLSQAYAAVAEHMPPDIQRGLRTAEFDIPDDATAKRYDTSYRKMVEFVGRMHKAGVPIVAGTDAIAGFTLHRELELYVEAGMTPSEALSIATHRAATVSGVADDRGHIAPGQRADLVLVDGDPTDDIGDLRKLALVIKGDRAYYPSQVHEALGIRPFAEPVRPTAR